MHRIEVAVARAAAAAVVVVDDDIGAAAVAGVLPGERLMTEPAPGLDYQAGTTQTFEN